MLRSALVVLSLLAVPLTAQERWIVHFRDGVDPTPLRAAIERRASVVQVDAVVADLAARTTAARADFARKVEAMGGRMVAAWWLIPAAAVDVPVGARDALARLAGVERLEEDRLAQPLAPIRTSTNVRNHNADEVQQAMAIRGTGTCAAILDTGLDSDFAGSGRPHPMLYRNGDRNNHSGPGVDGSLMLANVRVGAVGPDDVHDHGTGVCGVVGAQRWTTLSAADDGHAPETSKVGYCIADNAGGGSYFSTIISAWQQVAADKVRYGISAANNSYSGSPNAADASQQALDAVALNADVMVVVAAGNDGASSANSQSCANGLAVGAASPNSRNVTGFSSRGPLSGDTTRFFPDILAIGDGVSMPQRDAADAFYTASGTSFASPQVCGAACLVRSANPSLTALETKALLLATTEDVSQQNPGLDRNAFGMGWLRDDLAVRRAQDTAVTFSDQITATQPRTYPMAVVAGREYAVALSWYRTRLTTTAWSNLDLRVLDGTSVVASSATPRNLYEKVVFTAPRTGNLTIEVVATSLDIATVRFAVSQGWTGTRYVAGSYVSFGSGCSGTAPVALVVLPPAFVSQFASGATDVPLASAPCRYQQVFQTSGIPSGFSAAQLLLRKDPAAGANNGVTVDFEVRMGLTMHDMSTIEPAFDNNFDSGAPTTVFTRKQFALPAMPPGPPATPTTFFLAIPLDAPFVYDRLGQNVLLEVVNWGNANGNQPFTYPLDESTSGGASTVLAPSPTATSGQIAYNRGLVIGLAQGNGGTSMPVLSTVGAPEIGASFQLLLRGAGGHRPALCLTGTSNTSMGGVPLPLSLHNLGAPGCALRVAIEFLSGHDTDTLGTAVARFTVPLDSLLTGAHLYSQFMVLDAGANALGVALTNGGDGTIGGLR